MADNTQWHYTDKTGKQAGPITTAEFLKLIASKEVPSTAMAWKEGMAGWQPVGQINELSAAPADGPTQNTAPPLPKARSQQSSGQQTADTVDPYASPDSAKPSESALSYEEVYEMNAETRYGGVGRLAYFLLSLLISILSNILAYTVALQTADTALVFWGGMLVCLLLSIIVTLGRFKNIGMSRWWFFGLIVPLLNIYLSICLLARQEGWIATRKLDTTGKVIAWVFGIFIIATLALVAVSVLFFAGTAYNQAAKETERRIQQKQEQQEQVQPQTR